MTEPGELSLFKQFFQHSSAEIDVDSIYQEWQAVRSAYLIESRRPPQPVWGRRQLTEDGSAAWNILRKDLADIGVEKPFCIYLHVPFCKNKCTFCDCYSFRLANLRQEHTAAYLNALEMEMRLWSRAGSLAQRPLSTVHFGGGTPTFLEEQAFTRVVEMCRGYFSMEPSTGKHVEWALETTSSELCGTAPEMLDRLNFSRIHVGVQTLDEKVRERIGRRERAGQVFEKIASGVARGWVVSVDLIYGLPGQTIDSLLNDIHQLAKAGVDGFSLYILQISPRNRHSLRSVGVSSVDPMRCYFMIQAASQVLDRLGYRKTLFNHFAREKDTNLYFNFPERGEDCLALGTIADGVFGDYHYRHLEYKNYLDGTTDSFPGLQGGLRRSSLENRIQPLEVALLSAKISIEVFERALGAAMANKLFEGWLAAALIRPAEAGYYRLTASGSWLVGTMMQQAYDPAG